jgi:acyl-CoA synthetase (AMP-forming)/AMP-acid ligase II
MAALVDRLAAGLLAIGVYKGDRVGIWAPNRPEWLLLQFATARIGAILVTINPAYRTHELDHALNTAGVSALFVAPQFRGSDYMAMVASLRPRWRLPARAAAGRNGCPRCAAWCSWAPIRSPAPWPSTRS